MDVRLEKQEVIALIAWHQQKRLDCLKTAAYKEADDHHSRDLELTALLRQHNQKET